MKEIRIPQIDSNAPGFVNSLHPGGHNFSNTEELMHWIMTGEKKTIPKKSWNTGDTRPLSERF